MGDLSIFEIDLPAGVKKEQSQLEETFLIFTSGDQYENVVRKVGKNDSLIYTNETKFIVNN